mmetsp:Transcript_86702/g.273504  ORF Transcript_86702/g.273504 Transcript_86702/m.273504 type:complete len:250 (-) Transcript_86702:1172-1921(-)
MAAIPCLERSSRLPRSTSSGPWQKRRSSSTTSAPLLPRARGMKLPSPPCTRPRRRPWPCRLQRPEAAGSSRLILPMSKHCRPWSCRPVPRRSWTRPWRRWRLLPTWPSAACDLRLRPLSVGRSLPFPARTMSRRPNSRGLPRLAQKKCRPPALLGSRGASQPGPQTVALATTSSRPPWWQPQRESTRLQSAPWCRCRGPWRRTVARTLPLAQQSRTPSTSTQPSTRSQPWSTPSGHAQYSPAGATSCIR